MQIAPLTRAAIRRAWTEQNLELVQALSTNANLTQRLTEAQETASLVMGHAIERGLSPEQARELALDAIALPRADPDGDEDGR